MTAPLMHPVFEIDPSKQLGLRILRALHQHNGPVMPAPSNSVIRQLYRLMEHHREPSTADKSVISEQLDRLDKAGLLSLSRMRNRTAERTAITDVGRAVLEQLDKLAASDFTAFVTALNQL